VFTEQINDDDDDDEHGRKTVMKISVEMLLDIITLPQDKMTLLSCDFITDGLSRLM